MKPPKSIYTKEQINKAILQSFGKAIEFDNKEKSIEGFKENMLNDFHLHFDQDYFIDFDDNQNINIHTLNPSYHVMIMDVW